MILRRIRRERVSFLGSSKIMAWSVKVKNTRLTGIFALTDRLIQLLEAFPPEEPTRKRYISEIIHWSSKFGDIETGDPGLHHAIGALFAKGMLC